MTNTYDWPTERDHAIQAFNGDTPGATIEAQILEHFREQPAKVHALIDAIGRRVTEGQVRSGWAILARELEHQPSAVQATDQAERANAIRLVELWLRSVGGYVETWDELEDEVFGPRGRLRAWANDEQLVERVRGAWLEQRPRFEAAQAESEAYQAAAGDTYRRLRAPKEVRDDAGGEHSPVGAGARERATGAGAAADAEGEGVSGHVEAGGEGVAVASAGLLAGLAYFDEIELPTEETE